MIGWWGWALKGWGQGVLQRGHTVKQISRKKFGRGGMKETETDLQTDRPEDREKTREVTRERSVTAGIF